MRFQANVALLYCFALPLSPAPKDILLGLLVIAALIPGPTPSDAWRWIRRALPAGLLVWAAWTVLSVTWSPDRGAGFDEVGALRFLVTPLVLVRVRAWAGPMVVAFLLGVFAQHLMQIAQSLSWFDLAPRVNGRVGGLIGPVKMGTMCVLAATLHLAALLHPASRYRWCWGIGLAAAMLGLVFTGSRGPWLTAAGVLTVEGIIFVILYRKVRWPAAISVVVVGLLLIPAWPRAAPFVMNRVHQAQADLRLADEGEYGTDTGFRLLNWRRAADMGAASPFTGAGAGAFAAEAAAADGSTRVLRSTHAHSVYMHTLAVSGGVGLLAVMIGLLQALFRLVRRAGEGPWAAGLPFALLAWCTAGLFDTLQVGGQTFAVFGFILAVGAMGRWTDDDQAAPAAEERPPDA